MPFAISFYKAKTCLFIIEFQKVMVKFSNLTLYEGTKTISMGWDRYRLKARGGGGVIKFSSSILVT